MAAPGTPAPEAPAPNAPAPEPPVHVAAKADISVLLKRPDFLAAAAAKRWSAPGLVVQARPRRPGDKGTGARVGYTCSKKVGNAVARNRAKRRLRAAAAEALPGLARIGWDYVLIGRHEATAARPFPELVQDVVEALEKLHAGKGRDGGPPRRKNHGRGKGKPAPKPAPTGKA
ncbi:ribonuclease P protein component [Rhodovulum sp. DZ06]|uniref:ribonuclease P protein component n=1 Tax=Rhodovulum sp. DZ06 TaxID=3425126 RepID=UPI003D335845